MFVPRDESDMQRHQKMKKSNLSCPCRVSGRKRRKVELKCVQNGKLEAGASEILALLMGESI